MMTPEELATHFERIRVFQRQIQLAVYQTRMAAAYHTGKARDMVADKDRARRLTGNDDIAQLRTQLPPVIERIDHLNSLADAAWAELPRNTDKLRDYASQLAEAYDAINFRLRVYERLVRQSEKPLLADAEAARDLPCDAPSRMAIERLLRMEIEDYLALESGIASNLRRIDAERDAVVRAHCDLTDAYVRSTGRTDEISLAAGRHGARLATTGFDEREGFRFMDYAYAWIDRELDRVGQTRDS
jgi:hypothetical protein